MAGFWGAGAAHAACTVNGVVGAPITNDAAIVCDGNNAISINTTATGVQFTLVPGATLTAPGSSSAVRLGDGGLIDIQVGAIVSNASAGAGPLVSTGKNGVIFVSGVVNGRVSGDEGTVLAVFGRVNGTVSSSRLTALYNAGSVVEDSFDVRYASNAGSVGSVTTLPLFSNQEFYNEPGGQVTDGVVYAGEIGSFIGLGLNATRDSIVVNRSVVAPAADGRAVGPYPRRVANLNFTNEPTGVVNGRFVLIRGYRNGGSVAINQGLVNGVVQLSEAEEAAVPRFDEAPNGYDQRFENQGTVGSVEVESGLYVQRATGVFAPGSALTIQATRNSDQGQFLGRARIEGAHTVACLQGGPNNLLFGGGTLELPAGSALTIATAAAQWCGFNGTVVGPGRLVKDGTGTQALGSSALSSIFFDQLSRPPTDFSGGTEIRAGTIVASTNDALGQGAVSFTGSGGRLALGADGLVVANALVFSAPAVIDTGTQVGTLAGTSAGGAAVRKQGTGTLIWPGARSHTGTTTVDAGTLRLSGTMGGALTIKPGAVLEGSSSLAGPLTLEAGATLRARLDGAAASVFAAPGASLSGTLELIEVAVPAVGSPVAIVAVGGSALAAGTFDGLPQNSRVTLGSNTYRLSYAGGDGNDVTITRITPLLAPTGLAATAGDASITLAFTAPPSNGEPVQGYRATCNPGAVVVENSASPIVVGGLVNGTTYSCTVAALALDGAGPASNSVDVTPGPLPGSVRNLMVVDGDAASGIDFDPPTEGAPFLDYRAACMPGNRVVEATAPPLLLDALSNGTVYACEVTVRNAIGRGPSVPATLRPVGALLNDSFE